MRIAIVSTFPPRQCGIATFSADLQHALRAAPGVTNVDVIAMTSDRVHAYPAQVVTTIAGQEKGDYRRAAQLVARLGIDVVMIEHEFGIFGGDDGEYLLGFTAELTVPYALTLHTVLSTPTPNQDRVLRELCDRAAAVLVFTETARCIVVESRAARANRLHVVPHGAPTGITQVGDRGVRQPMTVTSPGLADIDTADRFFLSSFGLISAGKGIEMTLDAVAKIVPRHPEVCLVIAGQTHPEVARRDGEQYRSALQAQVDELDIAGHVRFIDRFLTVPELAELLAATDVFVTAYRAPEQIVSGALTFAVAAGCPVVSTPYRYAQDLLANGAGRLVPFEDSGALANEIIEFMERPDALATARVAARDAGVALSWPAVGRATAEILRAAASAPTVPIAQAPIAQAMPRFRLGPEAPDEPSSSLRDERSLPRLRVDHLQTLTDDVGIIQHATSAMPARATGYCVDDVARLVQVAHQLARRTGDAHWSRVTLRGVAFLAHAVGTHCPGMHNFMSYDRRWLDHPHHGDHVGRSIWALGDVLATDPHISLTAPVRELLDAEPLRVATNGHRVVP